MIVPGSGFWYNLSGICEIVQDTLEAGRNRLLSCLGNSAGNKNMNYVYMLLCRDGSYYTGWTNHLEKRIEAHNTGLAGAKYTRARRPVQLIYFEGYATKPEAMRREYEIKTYTRRQKEKLLEG